MREWAAGCRNRALVAPRHREVVIPGTHELAMASIPPVRERHRMPITHIDRLAIEPLARADRDDWERLSRGYHEFYRETFPQEAYDATWDRLMAGTEIAGLGAYVDGRLVGITHYLFHHHVWRSAVCYLQDLFVDGRVRGEGVGRALIERVADIARDRGAFRLYWNTAEDNARARMLYDKVAQLTEFIRYVRPLS